MGSCRICGKRCEKGAGDAAYCRASPANRPPMTHTPRMCHVQQTSEEHAYSNPGVTVTCPVRPVSEAACRRARMAAHPVHSLARYML